MLPNIDFFGYPFRKLRPTFGEQELRDVVIPDLAGRLWRVRHILEPTGNRLSLQ